jgi:DNA-binding response OmpR family regulator
MEKIEVLLVEDDENLGSMLVDNLHIQGYKCDVCTDGNSGLRAFRDKKYDLCILDVMLPSKNGFDLAKEVRRNSDVPIIFLTAKHSEHDRVNGFKSGADDYVTKPFSFTELSLRIEAILKRTSSYKKVPESATILAIGNCHFNYPLRTLKIFEDSKTLTHKEAEILYLFFSKPNVLVNRNFIMNHVWHNDDYVISRSLDVYLTKIRKLLKADPLIEIENLYGTGYMLVVKS